MKEQKIKLQLKKVKISKISNLNVIRGGSGAILDGNHTPDEWTAPSKGQNC